MNKCVSIQRVVLHTLLKVISCCAILFRSCARVPIKVRVRKNWSVSSES